MEGLYKPKKSDLKTLGMTLGEAFYDYPYHKLLLPDDELRKKRHPKIFRVIVNCAYKFANLYATSEACEGMIYYNHSDAGEITTWQIIRSGLFKLLFTSWGAAYFSKYDKPMEVIGELLKKNAPVPHVYLTFLGVHPDHQGKKLGSKMLNALLEEVDGQKLPCYLETFKEKNVSIYNRFGFELVEEYKIPDTPLTVYPMLRKAKK